MRVIRKTSRISLYCPQCGKVLPYTRIQRDDQLTMICNACEYVTQYASPGRIPMLDRLTVAVHKAIQEVKLESS